MKLRLYLTSFLLIAAFLAPCSSHADTPRPLRIVYEGGGALLGMGAGLVAGVILAGGGAGVQAQISEERQIGGLMVGMLAFVPLGINVAGDAAGGNGGYAESLLGYVAGLAAAAPVAFCGWKSKNDYLYGASRIVLVTAPVIGALLGYELSTSSSAPSSSGSSSSARPFVVTVGSAF